MTKCNKKPVSRSKDAESPTGGAEPSVPDRSRTRSRSACRGRRNDADDRPGVYSHAQADAAAANQDKANNLFLFGSSANTVQNHDKNKFNFAPPRKAPQPPPFQFGPPQQQCGNSPKPPPASSAPKQMNMLTQSSIINGFNPFIVPQQNSGTQFGQQQQSNFSSVGIQRNIPSNPNNSGLQFGVQSPQPGLDFNNSPFQFNSQSQQQGPNLNIGGVRFGMQSQQHGPNFNYSSIQFAPQQEQQNISMQFGPRLQPSNPNNANAQFGVPQQQFGLQPQPQFGIQPQQSPTNFNAASLQFAPKQQQLIFQPPIQPRKTKNVLKSRPPQSPPYNFSSIWEVPQQQPAFNAPPLPSTSGFNQSPQSNIQLPLILPPAVSTPQTTFGSPQPATPAPVASQPGFGTSQHMLSAPHPTPVTSQIAFGAPTQAMGVPQVTVVTSQPAFGAPQAGFNPRANTAKTKPQKSVVPVTKPAFGIDGPQPAQQSPVAGFNPFETAADATSKNSLSLAQIQNLDLDTIINLRKSHEADFRESMLVLAKFNPFASIPMAETRGNGEKSQPTGNDVEMREINLELPTSVVAATPLARRIPFFRVSERETTFGNAADGGNKKHADNFRRRKLFKSIAGENDSSPKPTKSRKREHVSKPMLLRKPPREDRCTSCHILLPKSSVFIQCNSCYVSQATQCDAKREKPCGISLKREGYYTIPPLEDLPKLRRTDGQCIVSGFTIGRTGYGSITYLDPVDVTNLNLDEIVHFDYREVSVYPDESKKPPVGQGLNRRAQITLDSIFPSAKGPRDVIRNIETLKVMSFEGTLRNMCKQNGTRFVGYRPETGSWIFMVEHFSKHEFKEPPSEEQIEIIKKKEKAQKKERIEIIERQIRLNEIHLGWVQLQRADDLIQELKNNVLGICEKFPNALREIEDKIAGGSGNSSQHP